MNLVTVPANSDNIKTEWTPAVFTKGELVAHRFMFDGVDAPAILPFVQDVLDKPILYVPGHSVKEGSEGFEMPGCSIKPAPGDVYMSSTTKMGTLRETVERELKMEYWRHTGADLGAIDFRVKEYFTGVGTVNQSDIECFVWSEFKINQFKIRWAHGKQYSERCGTCQGGLEQMIRMFVWMSGKIIGPKEVGEYESNSRVLKINNFQWVIPADSENVARSLLDTIVPLVHPALQMAHVSWLSINDEREELNL